MSYLRILQICFTKIVNSAGGAEKVFCNMSNYFAKQNTVVSVCCDSEEGRPFYYLNEEVDFINIGDGERLKVPFRVKLLNEIIRPFKKLGMGLEFPKEAYIREIIGNKLKAILAVEKPDVVICYELRSMVAIAECGFPLSKIVVMFHMDAAGILKSLSTKQEKILRKVKYVQVLLESYKQLLVTKGYTNVVCIGNIVPQYNPVEFLGREKTIIHVGRLDKVQKRQHLLIESFAKISSKYPDWKVKFFGGDSRPQGYEDELRAIIAKNQLENQVLLMGKSSEIESELRKASIFAFPSAYEGFPLALTEAMSMGLPSVGYLNTPAVNELIRNDINGFLCEESIEALADVLEKLMQNETKRINHGKQAEKDMTRYSAEKIFSEWNKLLDYIVKE